MPGYGSLISGLSACTSMGLGELFFSLPAIINRDGVAGVLSIPLNRSEQKALETPAEAVKQYVAALDSFSLSPREMLKGV